MSIIREFVSGEDGTISSSRVLMYVFSIFSMVIIGLIVNRILSSDNPAVIGMYLSNLPFVITSLMGLISLPYGINKSAAAVFSSTASKTTSVSISVPNSESTK